MSPRVRPARTGLLDHDLRPLTADERAAVLRLEFVGRMAVGNGEHAAGPQRVRVYEAGAPVGDLPLPRIAPSLEARHSPDGFSWGYGGSGPAELARAILMRAFPGDGPAQGVRHPANYQRFKAGFIAIMPPVWTLTGARLVAWYDGEAFVATVERAAGEAAQP